MGNKHSKEINYAIPIDNPDRKKNETSIYRNPDTVNVDPKDYQMEFGTIHDIYKKTFKDKLDDNCIGLRLKNPDGTLQNIYTWHSKKEIKNMAEELASGFMSMNLYNVNEEWEGRHMKLVSVYSKNSVQYLVMDIAMTMQGITTVPIYDTLGEEATEFIFNQTKIKTCFITSNHVKNLVSEQKKTNSFKYLKNLVIMDYDNYDKSQEVNDSAVFNLIPYHKLIEEGKKNVLQWANIHPDTAYCISYTSGTTGTPKGAVMTHKNLISIFSGVKERVNFCENDIHISYLPLAHIFERAAFKLFLSESVKIGLFNGDVFKLKEDLAILRPTIFISVPRLFNKFYDTIKGTINQTTGIKRKLVNNAIKTKLKNLGDNGELTHSFYDTLVFNKMKKVLGGRVRAMITASAPISVEVLDFLKIAFCCPIIEAYGQTEGTGAEFSTLMNDPLSGHVGGPLPQNEFKLVDVEEMNYTNRDVDDKGRPRPRGEIWVRGPNVIPGYFLNDQENEAAFTRDGWLKSGDIGQINPHGHRLQIIDRKKNIFKLSQGEYIAPEKLEGAYKVAHPSINDVFVYGDSFKSCLVGIVNIEKQNLKNLANELGIQGDETTLPDNEEFKVALAKLLNKEAERRSFNKLEQLKKIKVETTLFSDLGLLTATFKKKRNDFKIHYQPVLDKMYENLD